MKLVITAAVLCVLNLLSCPLESADPPKPKVDLYGDPLPAGADVRLGTMRFRHVALNTPNMHQQQIIFQDDRTLVSEFDGSLRFWNADIGELLRELDLGEELVSYTRFSPDRKQIATMSMQTKPDAPVVSHYRTRIWDVDSGKLISTLDDREGFTHSVFSADGTTFLTMNNNRVGVWDVSSGELLLAYKLYLKETIQSFAISPRDDELIVITTGTKIYLWNWVDGEKPIVLAEDNQPFESVAFSPTQPMFATIARLGRTIQIWDSVEQKMVHEIWRTKELPMELLTLKFTPDGESLICSRCVEIPSGMPRLAIWDVSDWTLRQTDVFHKHRPNVLAVSPDSKRVSAADRGCIAVFDLDSGKRLPGNLISHESNLSSIVFSRDSKTVVTASDDDTVRVWDAETGRQLHELPHDSSWRLNAAISPDGRRIATLGAPVMLVLWDAKSGQQLHRLIGHGPHDGRCFRLVFTPDSRQLLTFGEDLDLRVWDVESGKQLAGHPLRQQLLENPDVLRGRKDQSIDLDEARFSANAEQLLLKVGKSIHCFYTGTGQQIKQFSGQSNDSVAISADGTLMLSVLKQQVTLPDRSNAERQWKYTVRIHRLPSGKQVGQGVGTGRYLEGASAFSPDGRLAAIAIQSPQNEIHVWDIIKQQQLLAIKNTPEIMFGKTLAFSADNRKLACGMADYSVLIWDLLEEGLPESLVSHPDEQEIDREENSP